MDSWLAETIRLSFALLVAAFALILPGSAGVGGSLLLVVALVAVALVLYAGRDSLGQVGTVAGWRAGDYLRVLWLGPAGAALVVLVALDASAGEVQALGGIVGLIGMANYFLRPIYHLVAAGGRALTRLAGG
jgi:uncharacterized membrane protein YozB (DUF420 family)